MDDEIFCGNLLEVYCCVTIQDLHHYEAIHGYAYYTVPFVGSASTASYLVPGRRHCSGLSSSGQHCRQLSSPEQAEEMSSLPVTWFLIRRADNQGYNQ